jgi:hypothetical protein
MPYVIESFNDSGMRCRTEHHSASSLGIAVVNCWRDGAKNITIRTPSGKLITPEQAYCLGDQEFEPDP